MNGFPLPKMLVIPLSPKGLDETEVEPEPEPDPEDHVVEPEAEAEAEFAELADDVND